MRGLLGQSTLQSFGMALEEDTTMSLQPPGLAQLPATSRKSRARWGMGRETQPGTKVELVEGMEGIPWQGLKVGGFGGKSSSAAEEGGGF